MEKIATISDSKDLYPSTSSGENTSLPLRYWTWKKNPVSPTSRIAAQTYGWERNTLASGCLGNGDIPRCRGIPEFEGQMTTCIDLPGSIPDLEEGTDQHTTSCALRTTDIDDMSCQIRHVAPPKQSFMERLSINIKKISPFRQLTAQDRNTTAPDGVIVSQRCPLRKVQRCPGGTSDNEAQVYIPYECARFYVAKVVADMQQMKEKQGKMICDIEEHFQNLGKENEEKKVKILKKQHSDKMKSLKDALKEYQEHIKKNNIYWEEMIKHLKKENNQLIQEKNALLIQNKNESEKWEKKKTKNIEVFPQNLELLHSLTLKELQMLRAELERVQDMLKPQRDITTGIQEKNVLCVASGTKLLDTPDTDEQQICSQEIQEQEESTKVEQGEAQEKSSTKSLSQKSHLTENAVLVTQATNLEESQGRLEMLKRKLSKKEEEMTVLLKNKKKLENGTEGWTKQQIVLADNANVSLKKRLEKLHSMFSEVPETQQFVDYLLEESHGKVMAAKVILNNMINSKTETNGNTPTDSSRDRNPSDLHKSLEEAQTDLWEAERILETLGNIRSGCNPQTLHTDRPYCRTGSSNTQEAEMKFDQGLEEIIQSFTVPTSNMNRQENEMLLDTETKNESTIQVLQQELDALKKEHNRLKEELTKSDLELQKVRLASPTQTSAPDKLLTLQSELKQLKMENKNLVENFNSERTLRKKYYNMVEELKGKIRVFCRIRPLSKSEIARGSRSVVHSPDEYTVAIAGNRGIKELQFDQVFNSSASQEQIFSDTNRLIQSAMDGYNVCIFAYGQTGSGKTFTMIGSKEQSNKGITPRAFKRIFEIAEENQTKFTFKVSVYVLELYNERLLDLFMNPSEGPAAKLEIKKDKKGFVHVQGAEIVEVTSAEMLCSLFEQCSANRHTAATKMNTESSRSHLIIGVIIESTNLTNGSVTHGKLSLVDLAGSERASKTGAEDGQLKEANCINKSLCCLGDVISALSAEQSFIPYRNNKLTMLMQDSLGGNSKTLMFVNISPADYNAEESTSSLIYASRVKSIINSAQKNSETKEIARLKQIILKFKSGEPVEETTGLLPQF